MEANGGLTKYDIARIRKNMEKGMIVTVLDEMPVGAGHRPTKVKRDYVIEAIFPNFIVGWRRTSRGFLKRRTIYYSELVMIRR